MTALLPFALMLMQVGIDPNGGRVPGIPEELRQRPPRKATPNTPQSESRRDRLKECLGGARNSGANTIKQAQSWLLSAKGLDRAQAGHCLGVAQWESGNYAQAAASFTAARDAMPPANLAYRAQLGALAGNAALLAEDHSQALVLLDAARADAKDAQHLTGEIAIDRAHALVALNRLSEASLALGEARAAQPDNPSAWLLSATLSRRQGDLTNAQTQIERAAAIAVIDAAIGLEAGIIAALSGRDEAARKSFESVIALAPDSEQAAQAKAYLAQLQP